MRKRSLMITAGFTAFFFGFSLLTTSDSFAELPCWNDGSLSYSIGGIGGATDNRKGDISKKNRTEISDPVDVSNGNYFYQKEDLSIPSRGLLLKIVRIYNSLDVYDGPFGIGWSHNYNIFLLPISDGSEIYVLKRNADGSKDKFLQKTDGSFTPPAGCYDRLVKDAGGYTIWDKNGLKYTFDLNGKLKSIINRNLNHILFDYDVQTGVLLKATDSLNRSFVFEYNANHKVIAIRDSVGRTFNYNYDGSGNLSGSIAPATQDYPDGLTTSYTYDDHHRIVSITDPKGQGYVFLVYNQDDKVSKLTYGTGVWLFDYRPNLTVSTDPKGFSTEYSLNSDGTVKEMKQSSCYVRSSDPSYYLTIYVYDSNRERVKIIYPSGSWVKYVYDDRGNCLEVRRKRAGDADIDSPANDIVTRFTYDTRFNLLKTMTDPNGNISVYYYDYEEMLLGDLNGDTVTDGDRGNLIKISYPSVDGKSAEVKYTYNTYGQVVKVTDPNGNMIKYDYDPATGFLVKITKGYGNLNIATEMGYDSVGNVKTVKDPKGNIARFDYDAHNNLVKTTSPGPFNNAINYKYDANDNLIQIDRETGDVANPLQTTYYTYNILDKLETVKDTLNNLTIFSYDANGNRSMVRDADSNSTTYEYDERNLLWIATDSAGSVTEYNYDYDGNLEELTDANGNTADYVYDDYGRLTTINFADGTSESYWYDNSGNLVRKSLRSGGVLSYEYDNLNRIAQKVTPEAEVDYTYDAGSRLLSAACSGGITSYTYDALNRVTAVSCPGDKDISYEYDANGNRAKLIYPDSSYITYVYDALNRLTDIKDAASQVVCRYAYDSLSRRVSTTLLNGTSATYSYDAINRLTELEGLSSQGVIPGFAYTYDNISNRKTMTTENGIHSYAYDDIYQLKSTDYPVGFAFADTSFDYDKLGNRTTVTGPSIGSVSYTSNSVNQYTQVGSNVYSYDLNGNATSIATNTYSYDSENRLITTTTPTHNASYAYDPFGRRISKTVDGVTTKFLYDGDQIIAEYDGSDNMTAKYVYGAGIDEPIRMEKGGQSYYYHADGLGSVTTLTNSSGTAVESYSYDVFGKPSVISTVGNRYMFTGREYDAETGLYYYRARYYSADIGRFLQTDPIGYLAGLNLYRYCYNNPINLIDPLGLDVIILNDKEGAYPAGHIAYAIGDNGTRWDYYSKNGREKGNAHEHYSTARELLNSKDETGENGTKNNRYDRYFLINTSPDQDQKMRDYSDKHYNEKYDLIGNNCDDLTSGALDAGKVPRGKDSAFPSRSYEEIEKADSTKTRTTCKK